LREDNITVCNQSSLANIHIYWSLRWI
jgi:hypothetical protein